MKRSGPIKRKTPMKRTGFKRKKKTSPLKKAKDKAWGAFSKYIRGRDAIRTTGSLDECVCCTCGKTVTTFSSACHAGHWIAGRKGLNLFEEHGCHGQCSGCNIWGAGKQASYEQFMIDTYGHDEMDRMTLQANTPHQFTVTELEEIEAKYKERYNDLRD